MDSVIQRFRTGGWAALFTLVAGICLTLLSRVTVIAWSDHTNLYIVSGIILIVASIGPLVPAIGPYCEILVWNGAGWAGALAILGLESIGAMPIWPIMLLILALSFWPREPERSLPISTILIALFGGALVCWLAWAKPDIPAFDTWLGLE